MEKRAATAPIAREFCGSAHRRIGQGETSTDFNLVALLRRPFAGFLEFQFEGSCVGSAKQDRVINYNSFDLKFWLVILGVDLVFVVFENDAALEFHGLGQHTVFSGKILAEQYEFFWNFVLSIFAR